KPLCPYLVEEVRATGREPEELADRNVINRVRFARSLEPESRVHVACQDAIDRRDRIIGMRREVLVRKAVVRLSPDQRQPHQTVPLDTFEFSIERSPRQVHRCTLPVTPPYHLVLDSVVNTSRESETIFPLHFELRTMPHQ